MATTTITNPSLSVSVGINAATGVGIGASAAQPRLNYNPAITAGNGTAGNVSALYSEALTTISATPVVLNLTSALDPVGNAIGLITGSKVRAIIIQNNDATGTLTVTAGTDPFLPASEQWTIKPGGCIVVDNPAEYSITSTTGMQITLTGSAALSSVNVIIMGRVS